MAKGSEHTRAATAREVAGLLSSATGDDLEALVARYGDDPRRQVQTAVRQALRRAEREQAERERVLSLYHTMRELGGAGIVLGVDEVGRGAVAGPLTVAAVALPDEPIIWGLNDSKQLRPERREELKAQIETHAVAIGIAHVEASEIDRIGMASALRRAMAQAIADADVDPDCVLIDGNPVGVHPRERCLVKGDARIACIAAASIYAKVVRDALMVELDARYPGYHLASCKGYGSAEHIDAIRQLGLSEIHRASFCANFMEQARLF